MSDVLTGTVNVPGAGKLPKKYVAVGVAGIVGIVGWAYYRRSIGADEADEESYYADTRTGASTGNDAYDNPGGIESDDQADDDDAWKPPTTDQEWSQRVIEMLSWYEPGFVSQTLGKYLSRQPLTADEATLIREAWAQVGQPPGKQVIITKTTVTTPTPTTPKPTTPAKPATPAKPSTPKPATPAKPAPKPTTPAKPAYRHERVVVKKYTTKNPPWQSTISGIAGHYGVSVSAVWNDPKNASVKRRRGAMNKIRPGDVIYVKVKNK